MSVLEKPHVVAAPFPALGHLIPLFDLAKLLASNGLATTPQLVILCHPSVGAFISHCGWNSALESISLGVPILAWPMFGDQHFNSKLFAQLGVGIQFCEHRDGLAEEERVEEVVRMALVGDKGEEMREREEKLKETAADAVKQRGSSAADLTAFVSHMNRLNKRPTED